jgi:hypothetical protein
VKLAHLPALSAVALAVVLLMTPAAVHRLAYQGEDNRRFFALGSRLVTARRCRWPWELLAMSSW